jgi:transmembrane sensor
MSTPSDIAFLEACRRAARFDRAEVPDDALALEALRSRLEHDQKSAIDPVAWKAREDDSQGRGSGRDFWPRLTWRRTVGAIVAGTALMVAIAIFRFGPRSLSTTEHTYATATGQHATISLSDGSRVTLAPESRLTLNAGFGTTSRMLTLVGEAYFDVRAVGDAPFVVRTGMITTRVLGTTFSVRRYPSDTATRVAVLAGKVTSGTSRAFATLRARAIGTITDSTAVIAESDRIERNVAWTRGSLAFDDTPLPVLLATLGRWYGYDFRITDSVLARKRVTGEFRVNAPSETLAALADVLSATVSVDRTTVTLHPRKTDAETRRRDKQDSFRHSTEVGK